MSSSSVTATSVRLTEINMAAFMCADAVWLWQNAAFHAHIVLFYEGAPVSQIFNALMWTICIPSLIGGIVAYHRSKWQILLLLYIAKNMIMTVMSLLRAINFHTGHVRSGYEDVPDFVEWLLSSPFFAYGAYITVKVVQQTPIREALRAVLPTKT